MAVGTTDPTMSADQQTARMTAATSADSSRFSFRRPKKKEKDKGSANGTSSSSSSSRPRPAGSRPSAAQPPSSSSRRNRSYSPTPKQKKPSSSKSRPTVNRTNSQIMMVSRDYSIEAATEEVRQAAARRKTSGQPSLRMAASERLRLREILMADRSDHRGDDSSDENEGGSPRASFDVADSSIYRGEAVLRFRELLNDDNFDASELSLGDSGGKSRPQAGRSGRRRGPRGKEGGRPAQSRRRSMSCDDKDVAAYLRSEMKGGGRPDNDEEEEEEVHAVTRRPGRPRPDDNNSSYSSGHFKDSLKSSGKQFDEKIRLALEKKERKKAEKGEKKSSKRERRKSSLLVKGTSRRRSADKGAAPARSRRRSMSCDDKEVAMFLKLKEGRQNRSSETSVEGHRRSSNSLVDESNHTHRSQESEKSDRKERKASKRERRKSSLEKQTRRRSADRNAPQRSRRRSMSCDDKDVAAFLRGRGERSNSNVGNDDEEEEEEEEEVRAVAHRPFEHDPSPPKMTRSEEYDREIHLERQSEERQRLERERNTAEQAERVAQRRFERWKRRSQIQHQPAMEDDGDGDGDSSGCGTMRRSLSDPDLGMSTSGSLGESTLTRNHDDDAISDDGPSPPPVRRPVHRVPTRPVPPVQTRPAPGLYQNRRGTIDQHAMVNFVKYRNAGGLEDSVMGNDDDVRPVPGTYDDVVDEVMPRDSLRPNGAATSAQQSPGGNDDDHASVLKFSTTSQLADSAQLSDGAFSQRFSMDEYIQLKMSVAELRSELQEAHAVSSRCQARLREVETERETLVKKNKMLMGIVVGGVKEGKLKVSVLKGLKD